MICVNDFHFDVVMRSVYFKNWRLKINNSFLESVVYENSQSLFETVIACALCLVMS